MRFSYNWIKELSGTKKSTEELIDLVMLRGFELEESYDLAEHFKNFVVGEVKSVEKHPDADRLNVAKVDLGKHGSDVQIVCGAPNLKAGQKVPVAMPGAILPNSKIEIKKAEMRGVESNGMICAEDEIGLGKDHEGIMVLEDSLEVGANLSKALKLKDHVLDFDILPNRAHDCLSYQGLAREVAAMEGRNTDLNTDFPPEADPENTDYSKTGKLLEIEIEDEKLCPRYMGAVLEGIKLGESPDWMKARLVASGMEPINNVVDITNYVMLETGSPLHAFDFAEIAQGDKAKILVRKAKKQEKLELLSDDKLELDENDLLITDGETPVALAGIKGGKKSGINSGTNRIVLEAANFDLLTVRKSRQRHALATEAQARFEKGISPFLTEVALERAVELLKEYAGAKLVEVVDQEKLDRKPQEVEFDIEKQTKLLGEEVSEKQAFKILENLGFKVKDKKQGKALIEVPYWRLDIEGPFDFAEEIGRIKGYEKIEAKPLMIPVKPVKKNLSREFEWSAKDVLTALSFDEIISYSFYGERDVELGKISGKHFELENPNSESQNLMRRTLLPGVIAAGILNQKSFDEFGLFEIGRVYFPGEKKHEELRLAGAYFEESLSAEDNFYKAKAKIKSFLEKVLKREVEFETEKSLESGFFHSTRTARIVVGGDSVGSLGEISPSVVSKNKIKKTFVVFEIDFEKIFAIKKDKKIFQEIQKFPYVERDLAMFVKSKTEVAEVEGIIKNESGEILKEIKLFDIFKDEQNNKKSFAFHLKFGKSDSTLKGKEVDKVMENVIKSLEEAGHQVRK